MGFYGVSMGCLWDFHAGSLEFLRHFKGMSMGFPLDSCVISMVSYDVSMGFLRGSYGISMIFLLDSYGDISMRLLWDLKNRFLWNFKSSSMIFQ